MAAKSAIFILSLLFLATVSNACGACKGYPTPKPKPKPTPMPTPMPNPTPKTPPVNPFCPRDTLKLGVCADLLGGLVNLVVGSPPSGDKCCPLLEGLADLEVAACLCTAIKASVLGINLNVPLALSVLLSACQKTVPDGFKCV